MPNKRADPIGDVAAQIVANDPQIKARMQKIVNALLDDAEHVIRMGTPQARQNLFRSVVPALMRSMQSADANASEADEKKAWERMKAQMRGENPPDPPPEGS